MRRHTHFKRRALPNINDLCKEAFVTMAIKNSQYQLQDRLLMSVQVKWVFKSFKFQHQGRQTLVIFSQNSISTSFFIPFFWCIIIIDLIPVWQRTFLPFTWTRTSLGQNRNFQLLKFSFCCVNCTTSKIKSAGRDKSM